LSQAHLRHEWAVRKSKSLVEATFSSNAFFGKATFRGLRDSRPRSGAKESRTGDLSVAPLWTRRHHR
jgi:hypothetical protein